VAVDGTLYETDVYVASNTRPHREVSAVASLSSGLSSGLSRRVKTSRRKWGGQAVLVLVGVRLGIDSVNPVYHDSVKVGPLYQSQTLFTTSRKRCPQKLFTLPQSTGIAGGRPSSSYYFIGYQADHLFYLDPHHTRPAVPLQPLRDAFTSPREAPSATPSVPPPNSRHRRREGTASAPDDGTSNPQLAEDESFTPRDSVSRPAADKADISSPSLSTSTITLDSVAHSYATSYSPADLRTYHCDRIRKMPISSLDPSMLLGFLCRDEADWKDLRARITEVGATICAFFPSTMRSSLVQLLCHLCSSAILVQYSPSKTSLHHMAMTRIRTSGCNPCLSRVLSCPVTNARLHPLSLILLNYQTQSLKSLRLASKRLHPHNAPPATSHSQVAMETPTTIGSRLQPHLWPPTPDAYISALKVLRPRPYDHKPQHPPYSPVDDISLYQSSLIQCPCRNHLFGGISCLPPFSVFYWHGKLYNYISNSKCYITSGTLSFAKVL